MPTGRTRAVLQRLGGRSCRPLRHWRTACAGDAERREHWLGVLAEFRGVPRADAWRGCGHGELFEAMVLLHLDRPGEAFDVITADGDRGLFGLVFSQWTAAVSAEAAVLAERPDAADRVQWGWPWWARDNPMAYGHHRPRPGAV